MSVEANEGDDFTRCSICYYPFDVDVHKPKFLTCLHTFCINCIRALSRTLGKVLTCPKCNKETSCADEVEKLTDNHSALQGNNNSTPALPNGFDHWCIHCQKEALPSCMNDRHLINIYASRITSEGTRAPRVMRTYQESPKSKKKAGKSEATPLNTNRSLWEDIFPYVKDLVDGETILTHNNMETFLDVFGFHLIILKNVTDEVAYTLSISVAETLIGKVFRTLESFKTAVKVAMKNSLAQLVSPGNPIDFLQNVAQCKINETCPYVISFWGVNGVGKTTTLSKLCYWLVENDYRVLIAACDTTRPGAIEQLRTHVGAINALHPAENHRSLGPMVQLYENGYENNPTAVAIGAINQARYVDLMDVVLIDTSGCKNTAATHFSNCLTDAVQGLYLTMPDLANQCNFGIVIGDATDGNGVSRQVEDFQQYLAMKSSMSGVDGVILSKFDTIADGQIGALISNIYSSGKPIIFIGTGQTYADLKCLNVDDVVSSLME